MHAVSRVILYLFRFMFSSVQLKLLTVSGVLSLLAGVLSLPSWICRSTDVLDVQRLPPLEVGG